ncbi:MAG: hypothetical protein PHQ18_01245 [Patescibacteria group bacterium]|nr:hypothetical protein [Patescibacteria group bacterium]
MELGDNILLAIIQEKHLYWEKNSLDKKTGESKDKYKLACKKIEVINAFSFFVGSSQERLAGKYLTYKTEDDDWCEKYTHLFRGTSYFDLSNAEIVEESELLTKIRKGNTVFSVVAKLRDDSFSRLISMAPNIRRAGNIYDNEKRNLILMALGEESIKEEAGKVLKNLDLV